MFSNFSCEIAIFIKTVYENNKKIKSIPVSIHTNCNLCRLSSRAPSKTLSIRRCGNFPSVQSLAPRRRLSQKSTLLKWSVGTRNCILFDAPRQSLDLQMLHFYDLTIPYGRLKNMPYLQERFTIKGSLTECKLPE